MNEIVECLFENGRWVTRVNVGEETRFYFFHNRPTQEDVDLEVTRGATLEE
ncbi:MAG: hypothetical protein HQL97_04580 [Magnetococcales bacterium]|nr:hypothetical protein [Magnetococcales bacterium]